MDSPLSQLKTDFRVAPVYLNDVSRIQSLLCVYFLVLLVEALLERELRQAMEREGLDSLPLYPEDRPCRRPTARRVIDLFDDVHRHTLSDGSQAPKPSSSPSYPTSNAASSSSSESPPPNTEADSLAAGKLGENRKPMLGKGFQSRIGIASPVRP